MTPVLSGEGFGQELLGSGFYFLEYTQTERQNQAGQLSHSLQLLLPIISYSQFPHRPSQLTCCLTPPASNTGHCFQILGASQQWWHHRRCCWPMQPGHQASFLTTPISSPIPIILSFSDPSHPRGGLSMWLNLAHFGAS